MTRKRHLRKLFVLAAMTSACAIQKPKKPECPTCPSIGELMVGKEGYMCFDRSGKAIWQSPNGLSIDEIWRISETMNPHQVKAAK